MKCRCGTILELRGASAKSYANDHLEEISVDALNRVTNLSCPETGERFTLEFPQAEYHGGGSPLLRKIAGENSFGWHL